MCLSQAAARHRESCFCKQKGMALPGTMILPFLASRLCPAPAVRLCLGTFVCTQFSLQHHRAVGSWGPVSSQPHNKLPDWEGAAARQGVKMYFTLWR